MPNHAVETPLKLQLRQRTGQGRCRQTETTDLTVNHALPPNLNHPLATLSAMSREECRINDLATILASIARRKALRTHQPSEDSKR